MNHSAPLRRAVLLAAGRGKRLKPYTDTTPKPLLVHRGKPTLDYLLDSLQQAGVDQIVLVTHHLHEQVAHYAQLRTAQSTQQIQCIEQTHLFGTAHALQCVMQSEPGFTEQPFILSATDYLVPKPFFSQLLNFHTDHGAAMSVSLKQLPEDQLAGRSSVRFHPDCSIAEIVEKPLPGTAPSSIGANLTFVLPPEVAPLIEEVPVSARGEREVQYAINQWLSAGGVARGLVQATPLEWSAVQA